MTTSNGGDNFEGNYLIPFQNIMMSLKQRLLAIFCLIAVLSKGAFAQAYHPTFWLEDQTKTLEEIEAKGWNGMLYWAADRDGDKMQYYYRSPYLEKQQWAVRGADGLGDLVKKAHQKGMKVMANIEAVNPYHWEQNPWNAENIRSVASDLAATGIDAVFEECFEAKPDVFLAMARELKNKQVTYISGTDPMLLREPGFSSLWKETGAINIYNYYLKRDQLYNVATLTQHGSLGLAWAKYWNKPTSMISPLNRDWGIDVESAPAVVSYLCMIRALQFRLDNFMIFGGAERFDPLKTRNWINTYVEKQEKNRPLMNIVVLLKSQDESDKAESAGRGWDRLFNSGDAITSGAFNAGYNVVVSDKILPADAYWIYTPGATTDLPLELVRLMQGDKPVFLQSADRIPGGIQATANWKAVLAGCGVDASQQFKYAGGTDGVSDASLPESQEEDIPYTGYYKGAYLRFTGADVQRGRELRAGTILPEKAIKGKVLSHPNETYGKGPYLVGLGNKYLVTTTALNWQAAYPISDLLSGSGVMPGSNVWGIAGSKVSAFLAIETTELELRIPGLTKGAKIHVQVWDRKQHKKLDQILEYTGLYKHILKEYDFILIDTVE